MGLRVSKEMELVEVFEAKLLGENGEVVAQIHGDSMRSAREMAVAVNVAYEIGAQAIQVGAQAVRRYCAAVIGEQRGAVHRAYGATPEEALGRAEFWLMREPTVLH